MAIKLGVGSNLTSPQSGVPHRTSTQGPVLVFYCPFGMRFKLSTAAAHWYKLSTAAAHWQAARRLDSESLAGSPGASAGGAAGELNSGRGGSGRHNAAGWRIGTPGPAQLAQSSSASVGFRLH